jgi:hypothetical protein
MKRPLAPATADLVEFIRSEGMVLESAKGPVPNLVERIAGSPVAGSWWTHPQANAIYKALTEVRESSDVMACRLVNRKVTLVHRRLWSVLLALRPRIPPSRIAVVEQRHTASGRHAAHETPLAEWVADDIKAAAASLDVEEALRMLEAVAPLRSLLGE